MPVTLVSIPARARRCCDPRAIPRRNERPRRSPRMAASTAAASQMSPLTKRVVRIVRDGFEVREIPGIGQLIIIDDSITLARATARDE